jgi:hypothetical protein
MARPKAPRRAQKRAQPASARLRDVTQRGKKVDRPIADEANSVNASSADNGEHTVVETGRVIQVNRQAAEKSAENLEAVLMWSFDVGRRAQRTQQAWLRVVDRSLNLAVQGPAVLPNFKSIAELVEAQQNLCVETLNCAVECGTRFLQLAERTTQKAG